MRYFLNALPSLAEVVTMGKILFHVREQLGSGPRFDLVLLDAPATGHGLGLLKVSRAVLATVPPGPLQDDMRWMAELLEDPVQTAINLVTLPTELPVNEMLELDLALRQAGLPRGACFVNGVWPNRFAPGELELIPDSPPWRDAKATAARMQARADRCAASIQRVHEAIDLPSIELPQLFVERFGPAELERFSALLDAQLAEPSPGGRQVAGVRP
jgi:anion-transporting  ArsA/GET3 family ATPase